MIIHGYSLAYLQIVFMYHKYNRSVFNMGQNNILMQPKNQRLSKSCILHLIDIGLETKQGLVVALALLKMIIIQ